MLNQICIPRSYAQVAIDSTKPESNGAFCLTDRESIATPLEMASRDSKVNFLR